MHHNTSFKEKYSRFSRMAKETFSQPCTPLDSLRLLAAGLSNTLEELPIPKLLTLAVHFAIFNAAVFLVQYVHYKCSVVVQPHWLRHLQY